MPELSITKGDKVLSKWTLDDRDIMIGRGSDCHVILEESMVSWHHAKISKAYGGYLFEDLGSTNGSTINGLSVNKQMLKYGDTIKLGTHNLCFNLNLDDKYSIPSEKTVMTTETSSKSEAGTVSIRYLNGQNSGKTEDINESFHMIGKGSDLAAITNQNGSYTLKKISGKDPLINGIPVSESGSKLKDYDTIKVGELEMRFINF